MNCTFCTKIIIHRLNKKSKNHFCNGSCAAKYNNYFHPKRIKVTYTCSECNNIIEKRSQKCRKCAQYKGTSELIKQTTILEIKELYKEKTTLNYAAKIRGYGKTVYEQSNKPKYCVVCGYSKHYEVCHIKAVKDFPNTATMAEVHSIDNLIALCPNCHWEFDHGLISL